jgi:NAD(P)-dependent dehydrogenase (short-subunit alcohol dehydrogenase family)/acyl carrier protein
MAPFGRFVELGKRDFYAGTRIGLRPLRRNVGYFGVDLDAMLAARPASARPLLAALAEALGRGEITPLPHRVFPARDAVEAFRLMQRSGHVGKLVLTAPAADAEAGTAAETGAAPPLARPDRAWLVTGGTRGFGLALAERLAARGAGALWLLSRSGTVAGADASRIEALRARGTRVNAVACDVADETAVRRLLARIAAEGPALHGVAHAAMVLDDALLAETTPQKLEAVVRPKMEGAAVLDRLTRPLGLDHFLLFSSVAALFGNPGQTAYVAANAGLEAVARARLARGLPALAVQWGPIADAGVLAADAAARERLERSGAVPMPAGEALDALETALAGRRRDDAVLTIAPMRWGRLAAELPVVAGPLFEAVDRSAARAAGEASATDLARLVAGLDDAAALRRITELFRAEAAAILRLAPEAVDPGRPMADFGFDSLMAVELKLSAEEKFGVVLPVFSLSEGATLAALAARVLAGLRRGGMAAEDSDDEAADDLAGALVARHAGGAQATAVASRLAAAARSKGAEP